MSSTSRVLQIQTTDSCILVLTSFWELSVIDMVNSLPGPHHCRWSTVESGEVTMKEGEGVGGGKRGEGEEGGEEEGGKGRGWKGEGITKKIVNAN